MGYATTYDVRLRYMLDDTASKGMDGLANRAGRLSGELSGATAWFSRMAGAAAGVFSLGAAKKLFVDYNSEIEQAKIQTAGLLQGAQGGEFADQMKVANSLVKELEQRAKASTATTGEFVGFMKEVAGPLANAGLKAKDLAEFTAQSVIAAKAFGDEGIAAFDIQQALTSGVTIRDRFANKLLRLTKMTREEFNNLTTKEKLHTLQLALRHKAIKNMAHAQETSFAGVFSTLQDNLEIFAGKVGKPLFAAITAEIQSWNDWITKNQGALKQWGKDFSQKLVEAFQLAKKVAGFLVEHKDLLMMLAKAYLVSKVVKGLAGPFAGMFEWMSEFKKKGLGMVGAMGALQASVFALQLVIEAANARQEEKISGNVRYGSIKSQLEHAVYGDNPMKVGFARGVLKELRAGGIVNGNEANRARVYALAEKNYRDNVRPQDWDAQDMAREQVILLNEINKAIAIEGQAQRAIALQNTMTMVKSMENAAKATLLAIAAQQLTDRVAKVNARFGFGDQEKSSPKVNVTINRIEAKTEDPDRFIFQLETAFKDAARNPSTAFNSLKRG